MFKRASFILLSISNYKLFITIISLYISNLSVFSQNIGINTTGSAADASAILDVSTIGFPANDQKGLLIPRVELVQKSNSAPVIAPANSLLVYNTITINDVYPGYYYWNGVQWVRLIEDADLNNLAWLINGNSGTNPAFEFLGTKDNTDFVLRTNNLERLRVTNTGRVGINNSTPNALTMLDVEGNIYGNNFFFAGYTSAEAGNYADNYIIPFTEVYDPGGNFAGNTIYTAPVSGFYFLAVSITFEGGSGNDDSQILEFLRNGALFQRYFFNAEFYTREDREITLSFNCIMYMNAGQNARIRITGVNAGSTIDLLNRTFTGFLISK